MGLVRVFDGKRKTYRYRADLKRLGFSYSPKPEPQWYCEVEDDRLAELEEWCFQRKLEIETPYSKRGWDYRKTFFEANEPNCGQERFFCAYCGLPVHRDKITVDHLIAVKKAQRSKFYLEKLRELDCESVNDVRNLVACCKRCNSRKGTKAGSWVLRGILGRHMGFWWFMWAVRLLLVFGVLSFCFLR